MVECRVRWMDPTAPQGLEESLAFLRRVWDEQGPFDGLLGFSQGAAMASIFHHCAFSRAGKAAAAGETGGSSISEYGNLQARSILLEGNKTKQY